MLAICDEKLLGVELEYNNVRVKITRDFFGGSLVLLDDELLRKEIAGADSITAFGEDSLSLLEEFYPSVREASLRVAGVPYVQVFRIMSE